MKPMKSFEIRKSFLDYFRKHDHRVVPSSPVVPLDDPTLLFTNAGMVQFKNTFLGSEKRDYKRATSSQKCIRAGGKHNDLDNVGFTARHQTFFEMLGNFSFGDYFKEDAIFFAWEYIRKTLQLDPKRLYATVFTEDDDAERLWKKIAPELGDRVLRFGEKDNFWSMGDTGPCGPCSEIHYDRGEGIPGELNGEGDRFMEIWNLVFMQFDRDGAGTMTPLPKPSVDTGAGLERLCMVIQQVDSDYSTDLFTPLISKVVELSGKDYSPGPAGVPHRVIADHVRALTFALADNAGISNEGRGYVLRRILRRAARYGHQIGLDEPFIYKIVQPLTDYMGNIYPEIKAQRGHIELVIKTEEEQFNRTLETGITRFEDIAAKASSRGAKVIPGEEVFKLYDTYGFPADLTEIMAHEKGFELDWAGFNRELEKQRERSKAVDSFSWVDDGKTIRSRTDKKSRFVGYDNDVIDTLILASSNNMAYLEETPFYAESGGQVGDTGIIESERLRFKVENTKKIGEDIVHYGYFDKLAPDLVPDENIFNEEVTARIDTTRRADIQRNHTATHLLHKALRLVLGDHVFQQGSLVAPDRLRFDFSHFKAMSEDQIEEVERIVNEKIKEDLPVTWKEYPFAEAKKLGAMALFGEKYGDTVRVVKSGNFSLELCGGTHVSHTADIGRFFIISESAIAAGTRRIEAITGTKAEEFFQEQAAFMAQLNGHLNISPDELDDKALAAIKELQGKIHPRMLLKENLSIKLNDYLDRVKQLEKKKSRSAEKEIAHRAGEIKPDLELSMLDCGLLVFKLKLSMPDEMMAYIDSFKAYYRGKTILIISSSDGKFAITSPSPESANRVKDILVSIANARGGGKPTIRGAMPPDRITDVLNGLKEKLSS